MVAAYGAAALAAVPGAACAGRAGWYVGACGCFGVRADQSTAKAPLQADAPMFKLRDVVALITLLLTGIQVGVAWLERTQGNAGMMAGLCWPRWPIMHAAAAAVLMHALPTGPRPWAWNALMAALLVHAGEQKRGWPG